MAEVNVIKASCELSPDGELVAIYAEPMPLYWEADPLEAAPLVAVLREMDEKYQQDTGRIAGIEIVGFKDFDVWSEIPDLGLWQVEGIDPMPLRELLKRIQRAIRGEKVVAG